MRVELTKEKNWLLRYVNPIVPLYAFFSLICCWIFNTMIYSGTQIFMARSYHYDFTLEFDRKVPFVPAFILIYVGCYIFWAANYIIIARQGKKKWFQFAVADMLSRVVCGIFYVFLPTTNMRPVITGTDFCSNIVAWIYQVDAPSNLFPSIHCLASWFCYIGIRGNKKIPKWYRVFSMIFALLVCASTQFTKQHYIVDMIGGILLAEICYFIGTHTLVYQKLMDLFQRINIKVFGEKLNHESEEKYL